MTHRENKNNTTCGVIFIPISGFLLIGPENFSGQSKKIPGNFRHRRIKISPHLLGTPCSSSKVHNTFLIGSYPCLPKSISNGTTKPVSKIDFQTVTISTHTLKLTNQRKSGNWSCALIESWLCA
eukprot:Lithocolla_globosa_v1_NODE_1015_length_2954_cov_27.337703.p2 type:complete len:124 gc:universal NODE_1015_length_2954_cov_27.337703:2899-2528(-)